MPFFGAGCDQPVSSLSESPSPYPDAVLLRCYEPKRQSVALADLGVLGVFRFGVVVAGWQRPHAFGMVLGVLRIGVGFSRRVEGEAGGFGHRNHLLLAD